MVRAWFAIGLAACAGDATFDEGATHHGAAWGEAQAAPPLSPGHLELGVGRLASGSTLDLVVRGAPANANVTFLRGAGYGPGACPPAIGGLCAQLQGAQVLGQATANGQGLAALSLVAPALPVGAGAFFEAAITTAGGAAPALSEVEARRAQAAGAADPYLVGAAQTLASDAWVSPDALILHPVEFVTPVEVVSFTCRGRAAGGQFRAVLYDDAGGQPGQLVARSGPTAFGAGGNTTPVVNGPVAAGRGRHWLGVVFDTPAETWSNGLQGAPEYVLLMPFGAPFPTTFAGGSFYTSPRLNCAVSVR